MARHYAKVMVQLPDKEGDPPMAILSIDCDTCGETEIQIPVMHLGTVLRVLQQTLDDLEDDGTSVPMSPMLEATPANKQQARAHLDRVFPGWKADRLRRRGN